MPPLTNRILPLLHATTWLFATATLIHFFFPSERSSPVLLVVLTSLTLASAFRLRDAKRTGRVEFPVRLFFTFAVVVLLVSILSYWF